MTDIKFDKYQTRGAYHWQQVKPGIFNYSSFVAARYQQVINLIPQKKAQTILDIGCGDGVLSWLIYQKTKASIIGIDSEKLSIQFAEQEFKRRQAKAKFLVTNAYKLPFENNSFDMIVSTEVIEHLSDTKKFLAEIKRVLKPKGLCIITTLVKLSAVPEDKMHVKEFTPKELKICLKKYFSSVALKTSHPLWLKKLYLICLFKLGRYHLEPFRWLINLWVILTKLNPFLFSSKKDTNQIAICRQPL